MRSAQSRFSTHTLFQHCHSSESKLLPPWRFVSMGVSRQVLIRRKPLLPDHSRGKVEAGSRLKLEPNIYYFQTNKSTPLPHFASQSTGLYFQEDPGMSIWCLLSCWQIGRFSLHFSWCPIAEFWSTTFRMQWMPSLTAKLVPPDTAMKSTTTGKR